MSFTDAVRSVLTNFVGFSGRARRSEYWWFSLFYEVVAVVVVFSAIAVSVTSSWEPRATAYPTALDMGGAMLIAVVIADLILLSMFLPYLAVCIRRLHDTNRSGWFYLITLVPFGGIVLLVFLCEDSTIGPTATGPLPSTSEPARPDICAGP
jgi:uncharacterized membrane protein YhaH (DUF805 family)